MTREEAIQWIQLDIDMAKFDPTTGEDAYLNDDAKNVIEAQEMAISALKAQVGQASCEYCHEDTDGYVRPLEKNGHAFIRYGMDGWCVELSARGWHKSVKINYCPMCGRELKHG